MLTITVNKDGSTKVFTFKSAIEATLASIVSESGSPYANEGELITAYLQDNALRQWLYRYPPPAVQAAFVAQNQASQDLSALQNTPEIEAARVAKATADAAVTDSVNAVVSDWKV